jgi:hypothetical protein
MPLPQPAPAGSRHPALSGETPRKACRPTSGTGETKGTAPRRDANAYALDWELPRWLVDPG